MSKSVFISCVYEDSHYIEKLKKWQTENRLGNIVITFETEDKRHLGVASIRSHIKPKIEGSAIILVLVGNNTHNHEWIEAEVELANSYHKDIICVRIPNTTGAIPNLLKSKKLINFDPEAIKKEL